MRAVPGQQLHLPPAGAAADQGGVPAHRATGAHQRVLRHRQHRRHPALPGIEEAVRLCCDQPDAHQPLRPGDNYHPTHSHVMAALIRRFHEAKETGAPSVTCWGTGSPLREFLHADDLASAALFALEQWQPEADDPIQDLNVGTGVDLSIKELAELVAKTVGYGGEILWDTSKPDGTPKKQLDVSRLAKLN